MTSEPAVPSEIVDACPAAVEALTLAGERVRELDLTRLRRGRRG